VAIPAGSKREAHARWLRRPNPNPSESLTQALIAGKTSPETPRVESPFHFSPYGECYVSENSCPGPAGCEPGQRGLPDWIFLERHNDGALFRARSMEHPSVLWGFPACKRTKASFEMNVGKTSPRTRSALSSPV
jgi:hypothetical protein